MKLIAIAAALLSAAPLFSDVESAHSILEHLSEPISPKNIQVLLQKDADEVLIEVKGPYVLFNPHDGSRVASGLLGKRFMVRELEAGLKWGEEFPGIHQFYIEPRSKETSIFVDGIQYPGAIAVFGVAGKVHIVNDLDIETYVKAVLSPQFSSPLEPEVLSALAILTRTNAYYQAGRSPESFWHVAASDVGYQGSALIVPRSPVEKAVESTRHLILVRSENGQSLPIAASFTEHSAGKTAPYSAIFRREALATDKGVEAPHAALARQESKWSYQISKKKLAELLQLPSVSAIELFVDGSSSKVYAARVKHGSSATDFDFFALQQALGKEHLLSSDFTVSVKEDAVHFSGFGRGHGVGLCLYSASALAQNGENAVKILSKFFPETYLYNLNALPNKESP
jgi:stage II sporulation protein D